MKTLLAFMLPAFGHASICDRTPQVRDEIMLAIGETNCAAVTAEQLAAIDPLCFQKLDVVRCRSSYNRAPIAMIKQGDFDGLTGLQYLYLGGNQLTTLPAGVFRGLTSLEDLGLSENQLTTLQAGVFRDLTSLQILNLWGNKLTILPVGVFDSLTSLQVLWLQNNRLTALPAGAFDSLTRLVLLDLTGNHLVGLTQKDPLFVGLRRYVVRL